jgi:tetratricopeptide (TPR) repeat protein/transcriptional regulator with XRE-family HTH domain
MSFIEYNFSDLLRQFRVRERLSQHELAKHMGVHRNTIVAWEQGSSLPKTRPRVLELAQALHLNEQDTEYLFHASFLSSSGEQQTSVTIIPSQPAQLWNIPYRRNPYFTGRDELLHLLDQHLSAAKQGELTTTYRVALTQPQAIKGLGGIGKTQIAVEYAYRAREQGKYIHTLWMNAASKEALMTSFTALAELLPEFPAKNETDQQKLVEGIKSWLEQCKQRWLLIFDNADDLSLIQEYFPHHGNGSILLTTRANAVGSLAISIEVEKMGFVEGTHLLLHRAQCFAEASDEQINEAGNIVVTLDHFPLALEQAGAYIEETGCSFGNYLQLYQTQRKALLNRRGTQTTNYPDSVATTWSLSFQKVEQANPAAAELLRLCAFLAPDHIPEELITNGTQHWPSLLQQAATNPFAFDQMIESLLAFSLVKRLAENHLLSIHRLVQTVQLDMMDPEEQRQWAERVISAVNAVFPRDPRNDIATWPQCRRYLEQAQACVTLIEQWTLTLTEGADLLDRTGIYLYEHASYTIAEPLFQYALRIHEQSGGPEHTRVASLLYNLAILYREQGKYTEAIPLFQRALHIWKQNGGPEHVDVATALKGLAVIYAMQGKYTEAEPLFQRALRISEQGEGPEHPNVASSLSNLANIYRAQGKYAKAEPLYQRALHIWEQSREPDHPNVAIVLNSLATLYQSQGKYAEAEPLYQRALHIREQSVGPDHPNVASSLTGLGSLYRNQGKPIEAEPLYQRALHIWEQSVGPDHPNVASSLNNLGELYRELGKYAEAEPLYQRALHIWEQSVGPDHPNVAFSLHGLGEIYSMQGKHIEAELLLQHALSIHERVLEPDHPNIAEALYSLAALREAQGNIEEAASLYCRALAIREKVYGQQHPKTIDTHEHLDTVSTAMNRMQEMVEQDNIPNPVIKEPQS